MVTKARATEVGVALDVGVRLAVVTAGVTLSDQMIRDAFDAMREDLPGNYEDPDFAMRELEKMEESVLVINRTFHND